MVSTKVTLTRIKIYPRVSNIRLIMNWANFKQAFCKVEIVFRARI